MCCTHSSNNTGEGRGFCLICRTAIEQLWKNESKGHLSNEMSAMQPVDLNGKGKSSCKTCWRVLLISLVLEIRQLSCYPCCGLWLCARVFQHPPAESYACSRTTWRYSFQKVLVHLLPLQNLNSAGHFPKTLSTFNPLAPWPWDVTQAENHSIQGHVASWIRLWDMGHAHFCVRPSYPATSLKCSIHTGSKSKRPLSWHSLAFLTKGPCPGENWYNCIQPVIFNHLM